MQPARHRMVYTLLKSELAREGGIHALQLQTRTLEEEKRYEAKINSATELAGKAEANTRLKRENLGDI